MQTLLILVAVSVVVHNYVVGLKSYRVLDTYDNHLCNRPCQVNRPQTCYYDFELELYFALPKGCFDCPRNKTDCARPHCIAADGVSRAVYTVNRMLPGPAIHVCENDTIVVNVVNHLTNGEGTSIHWHGVLQHDSQFMDGVAMVTQCPIPIRGSFEYRFKAENAGTHFWHAHSGLQRADGLFGALVVRQPDELEPHLGIYDFDLPEHTLIVNDWLNELSINRFAHHHVAGGDNKPRSMLINGKGRLQNFTHEDNTTIYTPVHVFTVSRGRRYRFRSISNGILNCPIQISIDNHTMTMIASDGNAFEPLEVETFNIFAGERFDFVLSAVMPVGNYWIRTRGLADCGVKSAHQVAILRYQGAPDQDPPLNVSWDLGNRSGKKLNLWNQRSGPDQIAVADLTSKNVHNTALLKEIPDKKVYLAMDFNSIDNYHFHDESYYPLATVQKAFKLLSPQMNHISMVLPHAPPLSQLKDIPDTSFCNADNTGSTNCSEEFCECVHRIQVDLGDTVELVVIDEGVPFNANHPMHLHGHAFHVVGMDRLGENTSLSQVKELDAQGKLPRNLRTAVLKDTVTVPDGGYAILRFHADNPGFWFFHCHIEFHVDIGMGILIQVGKVGDMPPVPKNFPKCGNWAFNGNEDIKQTEKVTCVSGASELTSASFISLSVPLILFHVLNSMN
ncbi:uncharacterized protein LOC127842632 [Dreissena polymorpha]|uniref:uncharacterized protein LOC127842632 n=1 Tax=Dreissena polymorpha TaxID=45954 RepID=UPI002264F846|nr:uncharacterized protein LOC127842632 [Dreissena polymorpha]